jgi:hypothetical protein
MPETTAHRPSPSDIRVVPPTRVIRHSGATTPQEDRYVSTVGLLATLVVILTVTTVVANRDSTVQPVAAVDSSTVSKPAVRDNSGEFSRLDSLANDSTTAAAALTALGGVPLASDEDRVRAALVRFAAALSLGDKKACDALKDVRTIAPRSTKAALVSQKLTDLCPN